MSYYTADPLSGGGMRMARTRGLASGMLLLVLGAWAAIVPFIGDYLDFAYTPTSTWTWTSGRGWYEVAPGAAAFVGGLLLLFSANRAVATLGAWLGIAGGAWLIIGPQLETLLDIGSTGTQRERAPASSRWNASSTSTPSVPQSCSSLRSRWAGCPSAASVTCEPHGAARQLPPRA